MSSRTRRDAFNVWTSNQRDGIHVRNALVDGLSISLCDLDVDTRVSAISSAAAGARSWASSAIAATTRVSLERSVGVDASVHFFSIRLGMADPNAKIAFTVVSTVRLTDTIAFDRNKVGTRALVLVSIHHHHVEATDAFGLDETSEESDQKKKLHT